MVDKKDNDKLKVRDIPEGKSLVKTCIDRVKFEESESYLKHIFRKLGYRLVEGKIIHSKKEALNYLSARFLEEEIEHSIENEGLILSNKGIDKLSSREEEIASKLSNKTKEVGIIYDEKVSSDLKAEVLSRILLKKNNEASELIVKKILADNKIITINAENHKDLSNREMFLYRDGIYIRKAINLIESFCRDILGDSFKTSFMALVVSKIQADTCIDREDFMKRDKNLIPCKNGVLNIKDNSMVDYSPEMNFRQKYNANYKSEYNLELVEDAFFKLFTEDEKGKNDLLTLQEVIGSCFYYDLPVHNFAILFGSGRNSKGTILRIIKDIISKDSCEISLSKLVDKDSNQNFFLAGFFGKTANLAGDIDSLSFPFSGLLKNLTGGDNIETKMKGIQDSLEFISVAQNIFSTNDLPIFSDSSVGFWERCTLIKFDKITFVSEKDYNDLSKSGKDMSRFALKKPEEYFHTQEFLDSFFIWGIEGLKRLLKNQRFSNNKSPEEKRKEYIKTQNPVLSLLENYFQEDYSDDGFVTVSKFNHCRHLFLSKLVKENKNQKLRANMTIKTKQALNEWGLIKDSKKIDGEATKVISGVKFLKDKFDKDFPVLELDNQVFSAKPLPNGQIKDLETGKQKVLK